MKKNSKIKRILFAGLPSLRDFSIFFRYMIIVFIFIISLSLFAYISTNVKAQSISGLEKTAAVDSAPAALLRYLTYQAAGCYGLQGYVGGLEFTPFTESIGPGKTVSETCRELNSYNENKTSGLNIENSSMLIEIDYGATGRILNANASIYDTQVVQPGITIEYFASKIRGQALAADNPMSGRSVLAPVFILNQNMVNLAYGVVVIILIVSSLNILLNSLTGGAEEKVTIVQLLVNAGVTLVMITFYYEIAAIIYDLTVNYGNALVASIMSPFINSKIILERLSPGGDLSIVNLLNVYQFIGVSDALLVVVNSIFTGIYPVIAQSSAALASTLGGRGTLPVFLQGISVLFQYGGSIVSAGISAFLSSFLGNKEVFDTIIAWAIFFINLKIFFNLITSFVTFTLYVGFGPLLALGGINGGFNKISESFKFLVALGLVFPFTFLFIMLGSVAMNIAMRPDPGQSSAVSKNVLCKYSPGDPANTERGVIDRSFDLDINRLMGGNPVFEDPSQARNFNYVNQNIFDVVPKSNDGTVRDCRPSLFPVPWTFIPAPFGTIGQRQLQVQTIDALIRTFLGVVFLIMATRAPAILKEILEVKEMGSLQGLLNPFTTGTKTFFGIGATAVGIGIPLATGTVRAVLSLPFIPNKWAIPMQNFMKKFAITRNLASIADVFKPALTKYRPEDAASLYKSRFEDLIRAKDDQGYPIFSPAEAKYTAAQYVALNFDAITRQVTLFGQGLESANSVIDQFTKSLSDAVRSLQTLISLSVIDEI